MAGLYLTLRGTPIMYYGEEIGMKTTPPTRKEDVKDPIGRVAGPRKRAAMANARPCSGTEATTRASRQLRRGFPCLRPPKRTTLPDESKDPNSVLAFYKKVLKLRHTNRALLDGSYTALNENDQNVLSYLRVYKDQAVLVALNMSGAEQKIDFEMSKHGFASTKSLAATGKTSVSGDVVTLEPYGVFIGQLSK